MHKIFKVKVIKFFRHGTRVFETGEIGEIVPIALIDSPLKIHGEMIYDFYVKFPDYQPVGVHKNEVVQI